jgi:hypothetical protein
MSDIGTSHIRKTTALVQRGAYSKRSMADNGVRRLADWPIVVFSGSGRLVEGSVDIVADSGQDGRGRGGQALVQLELHRDCGLHTYGLPEPRPPKLFQLLTLWNIILD